MRAPEVSILIVSWNTRALTLRCLQSIPASLNDGTTYEIIVVDNGSRDGSAEALLSHEEIRLIRNGSNRGYAAAVNQAYEHARGEMILLLNSDVRLESGSLDTLVDFLRRHPEAAGVAPLYLNPDGSPQAHYHRLPTFASAVALASALRYLPGFARRFRSYRMAGEDFSLPRPVPQPSASCLLLRRSSVPGEQVFDERFPIFFNDVDLARSIERRGGTLWMTPEAVVVHELGASTRLLGDHVRARHHLASLVRYLEKSEGRGRLVIFRLIVLADRTVRHFLGLSGGLRFRDAWRALGGHPGPLPDGDARTWIVLLAATPWESGAHRQHELARQLEGAYRVLFVEPPGLFPRRRLQIRRVGSGLWRVRAPAPLPLGRFVPLANRLNRRFAAAKLRRWLDRKPSRRVLWIDEDLAAPMVGRLGEAARVYDATDLDWTFTRRWNRPHLRRALARAVRSADLVIVSSPALPPYLPTNGTRPLELLNGCDPARFTVDGPGTEAVERIPTPRIGYVGAADERACDADLIAAVAAMRPEWSFVIVGPVKRVAAERLEGLTNVHLLGPVPYAVVPEYVRGFDVCLIPYRHNGLAAYAFPKKFFEYLACGKAVVTTPLPALRHVRSHYREAATPEGFVSAIEGALAEASDPDLVTERRAAAVANSWDARGEELRTLLHALEARVR